MNKINRDKIYLYIDSDSETPEDIPTISMPYKSLKEFKKENDGEFRQLAQYSISDLLDVWGVGDKIKQLQAEIEKKGADIQMTNDSIIKNNLHIKWNKWVDAHEGGGKMKVMILKTDSRTGVKKGEIYKAKRYTLDPYCKVELIERVPDGYDPMCTEYLENVEILKEDD